MSILDEIRDRANQPNVTPRQDVLQQGQTVETEVTGFVRTNETQSQPIEEISSLKQLEDLLASFPEIAARVPVRLEVPIKEELDELCRREKITIETLLEALYVTCKDKESVMRQVLNVAKKRLRSRKEAGQIRSSLTKLTNLTKNKKKP